MYRSPADLLKPLEFTQEVQETLLWWCSFMPQPKLIHHSPAQVNLTRDASTEGYGGYMSNPVIQGPIDRKEGQREQHKSHRTKAMSTFQRGDQGDSSFLPDRQHNSSVLSVERGWQPLQETAWCCKINLAQLPQGWSDILSRVPLATSKSQSRYPVQREEAEELNLGTPAC